MDTLGRVVTMDIALERVVLKKHSTREGVSIDIEGREGR